MTPANNALVPTDAEILVLLPTVKLKDEDPKRMVWLTRKDALAFVRAVLAKWGAPAPVEPSEFCYFCGVACAASDRRTPAPASQPVVVHAGMEPVGHFINTNEPCAPHYEQVEPGHHTNDADVVALYTAAQVQAMLSKEQASRQEAQQQLEECKIELTKLEKYRAMLVASPSGPAREPLTDEQIEAMAKPFVRSLGGDHWHSGEDGIPDRGQIEEFARAIEAANGITAALKGGQHGTDN